MRITFYLNRPEAATSVLMMNVAFRGQRLRFGTGVSTSPKWWNHEAQEIRSNDPDCNSSQKQLNAIASYVRELHDAHNFGSKQKLITADNVKAFEAEVHKFLTPDISVEKVARETSAEQPVKTFFDHFQNFIDTYTLTTRSGMITAKRPSKSTLDHHHSVLKSLSVFEKENEYALNFDSINDEFYQAYYSHLADDRGLYDNSISNHFKSIKRFMKWGKQFGMHTNTAYETFHRSKVDGTNITLALNELSVIANMDLSWNMRLHLTQVRFLLQAFTGMRYGDLCLLKPLHFNDAAGVIKYAATQKNAVPLIIPIIPPLKKLLRQYPSKQFEFASNVKQNLYLKDIGLLAGLNTEQEVVKYKRGEPVTSIHYRHELLTTHVARRTFSTLSRKFGISSEAIAVATGHAPRDVQEDRYINFDEETLVDMFNKGWKTFEEHQPKLTQASFQRPAIMKKIKENGWEEYVKGLDAIFIARQNA